jgi:acetyltransferase
MPLFNPRSVAVFGASPDADSVGGQVFRRLRASGFKGAIRAVNPAHDCIDGQPCLPDLASAAAVSDLAVIATPAATVPAILEDCAKAGTCHAIVLSSGFGEGRDSHDRGLLAKTAHRLGVRVMGPNCIGLVRPWIGLDATFLAARVPAGPLAFVTQSGALAAAIADWAAPHDVGFSALVSMGNMTDVGFGEVLRFLEHDAHTRAVLLYVETIRHPRAFISALRSIGRHKPVIVLKAGRHAEGRDAARTHTGALTGADAVFGAAIDRAGALRVDSLEALFASAEILSGPTRSRGSRLAIVTNGGGAGILAADHAGDLAIALSHLSDDTLAALNARLPHFWSKGNPVDLLGTALAGDFGAAVTACLADAQVDGVLVLLTPQAMTDATRTAEAVIAASRNARKPVLAAWLGETSVAQARTRLSEAGIPDFPSPERAVDAFAMLNQYRRTRLLAQEVPGPEHGQTPPDTDTARRVIAAALARGEGMMEGDDLRQVLAAFHIPVTQPVLARTVTGAVAAARTIGFPVVMKVQADGIAHKSDVGGVLLNLDGPAAVRHGFRQIAEALRHHHPTARLDGVTVEPMLRLPHAREVLIGVSHDPVMGAALSFGAGGTLIELLNDTAIDLPPLNRLLVRRMIARTRVSRLLGPWRGMPPVDMRRVEDVVLAVSALVCACPEIRELDLNPLIAAPEGLVVLDARARIAALAPGQGPLDHLAIRPCLDQPDFAVTLRNGTQARLRPLHSEDANAIRDFLSGLSPETRRKRFLGGVRPDAPDLVARLTQLDYDRELALAMVDGSGRVLAFGRFVATDTPETAEFALCVADAVTRQGLGAALLMALCRAAPDHGVKRLEGLCECDNTAMQALARRVGFRQDSFAAEPGLVWLRRDLPAGGVPAEA